MTACCFSNKSSKIELTETASAATESPLPMTSPSEAEALPKLLEYDDFYYVGSSVASLESSDTSIVEIVSNNTLHVTGIGRAVITMNGKPYYVTTKKAKLAVILCLGQSNMTVISTGNESMAIKPARGTAYWNCLSDYESLSVNGVKGLFGGFADTFYKQTGEKCLLIQAAMGGTSITQWQTDSDYLGRAISIYNTAISEMQAYLQYYDITRAGYLWLQGETDCRMGVSASQYLKLFFKMHEKLNKQCVSVVGKDQYAFSFTGILAVRSWSGKTNYMRPLNIAFTGPRTAQYAMANTKSLLVNGKTYDTSTIHLISNVTEQWYSDESVASWFASDKVYYLQDKGVVRMIGTSETDVSALMPPDISSASNTDYPDQHYLQKGYNEMGADAATNLAKIIKNKENLVEDFEQYKVILRDFDGIRYYQDGETVEITSRYPILVPCVTDLGVGAYTLRCEFSSVDCPAACVDEFGQIVGLKNDCTGKLSVFLNENERPVLTVTVTLKDNAKISLPSSAIPDSIVYLSDLIYSRDCLFWQVNMADSTDINPQRIPGKDVNYNASVLTVADVTYEKGIGLHPQATADSVIEFDISSYPKDRFFAVAGSPKLADYGNGVICSVYADFGSGYVLLAKSGVLSGENIQIFDLNIEGAQRIKLVVNNNGNHNSDSTTWAYAVIYKSLE